MSIKQMVAPHENEVMEKHHYVYSENSQQLRLLFFRDPLIQFLWSRFRHVKNQVIIEMVEGEDR